MTGQLQPNFGGMVLPKLCPVIPTSNQDGCQAKNRKNGGRNFNCPLLLHLKKFLFLVTVTILDTGRS
jgi:hypothetical protein